MVDIIAFFDKEDIFDVMDTLFDLDVNKKAARLFFKLNEGTEVSLRLLEECPKLQWLETVSAREQLGEP